MAPPVHGACRFSPWVYGSPSSFDSCPLGVPLAASPVACRRAGGEAHTQTPRGSPRLLRGRAGIRDDRSAALLGADASAARCGACASRVSRVRACQAFYARQRRWPRRGNLADPRVADQPDHTQAPGPAGSPAFRPHVDSTVLSAPGWASPAPWQPVHFKVVPQQVALVPHALHLRPELIRTGWGPASPHGGSSKGSSCPTRSPSSSRARPVRLGTSVASRWFLNGKLWSLTLFVFIPSSSGQTGPAWPRGVPLREAPVPHALRLHLELLRGRGITRGRVARRRGRREGRQPPCPRLVLGMPVASGASKTLHDGKLLLLKPPWPQGRSTKGKL